MVIKKKTTKGTRTRRTLKLEDPNQNAYGDLTLTLESTAPLIQHNFADKTRRMILSTQMGKPQGKKAPRDPEADFLGGLHSIGNAPQTLKDLKKTRFGIPAVAFKGAAVRSAKAEMPMTDARGCFFVQPSAPTTELIEIFPKALPYMREDPVRLAGNTASIAIRPCFEHWEAKVNIQYNARKVTPEKLVSWFQDAGISNGVGDWRPAGKQSSGIYGTWRVTGAEVMAPDMRNRGAKAL